MPSRHAVFILLLAAALTGCGQMGPLYMPTGEEMPEADHLPSADDKPPSQRATDADES